MSSRSDQSVGSRSSRQGRWHREEACMKINLPIFKDEDAKDAVTYQRWRWDLTVYQCAGCRDHTLLPYAIRSLQGYPGELVWNSGTDITLDDVLTILDENYNNLKALDALNQELFQLWMADKETVSDWGIHLSRHLQVLAASFPDHFHPDRVMGAEEGLLLWWTSQVIKSNGSLPEGGSTGENIFKLPKGHQGAEKKDSIELPRSSRTQAADGPPNQWLLASSPWGNLRVTSHFQKSPPSDWHIWRKRRWMMVKTQRVMILVELRGWWRSSSSDWQGQQRMPKPMRNAVTIVAAPDISSIIAHLWKPLETKSSEMGRRGWHWHLTTKSAVKSPQTEAPEV